MEPRAMLMHYRDPYQSLTLLELAWEIFFCYVLSFSEGAVSYESFACLQGLQGIYCVYTLPLDSRDYQKNPAIRHIVWHNRGPVFLFLILTFIIQTLFFFIVWLVLTVGLM